MKIKADDVESGLARAKLQNNRFISLKKHADVCNLDCQFKFASISSAQLTATMF